MSEKINRMFGSLAKRYDLTNDLLSFGVHRLWRKKAVELSNVKKGDKVLDCAAGTGGLSIEFKKAVGDDGEVVAADFCDEMLAAAENKFNYERWDIKTLKADALNLPFRDDEFDVCCVAFGVRNYDSVEAGLKEAARVVKSGGEAVVLEFGQPKGIFSIFYDIHSKLFLPIIGRALTKNDFAYNYLQESASRFPSGADFVKIMRDTGKFGEIRFYSLTFGIAYVYIGNVL